MSGEAAKASREAARKKYYELTKWPALRRLDGSVGRGLHHYHTDQNIAPIKVPSLKVLQGVWHVIAWRTNNTRFDNKIAGNSVIMFLSATKMVKTYLFTSLLVHFRRIEPKKTLHTVKNCDVPARAIQVLFRSAHLVRHCWTEDLDDDYFEQKIGIKPHPKPQELQGELIILICFYLIGC